MILICVLFGNIKLIIEFAGFLVSIFNGGAMVSLIVLRKTKPDVYRPYKVWIKYVKQTVANDEIDSMQ